MRRCSAVPTLFARAAAGALALGLLTATASCASVPGPVRAEGARTAKLGAGKVTVVRYVDFQCPFCRRAHAALKEAIGADRDKVRVVNKHVPLSIHRHAEIAARASICAEKLGTPAQSAAVDDRLYDTDLDAQDELAIVALVSNAGLPASDVAVCMGAPETKARIQADSAEFDAVGGEGVPLAWVGSTQLDGAHPAEAYRAALDAALADARR